jgi:hypothetical protein
MSSAGVDRRTLLYMVGPSSFRDEVAVVALVIRFCLCGLLLLINGAAGRAALPGEADLCEQPELCFQAAAFPKERLGKTMNKEQVLTLKLERLQHLAERFSGSAPHSGIFRSWTTTSVCGSLNLS